MENINKKQSSKVFQILAGIFFICCVIPNIINIVENYVIRGFGIRFDIEGIIEWLEPVLYITMGIFIMIKKNHFMIPVCLGLLSVINVYYVYEYGEYYELMTFAYMLSMISTQWFMLALCVAHLIRRDNAFLKAWFVAVILSGISALAYIMYRVNFILATGFGIDKYAVIWILYYIIFALGATFYSLSLGKGAFKTPVRTIAPIQYTPTVPNYAPQNMQYTAPTINNEKTNAEKNAEELRTYKKMLDEGLISEADYKLKKDEILKLKF